MNTGSLSDRGSASDEHSTSILDERMQELRHAQAIINGLRDYRENLLTCRADLEPAGRLRVVELSNPPRDDHDRAVLLLVADYERLLKAVVATIKPAQKATAGDPRGKADPSSSAASPQDEAVREAETRFLILPDGMSVCLGGRFNGWLMRKHPDGQWVSVQKLPVEPLALEDWMKP